MEVDSNLTSDPGTGSSSLSSELSEAEGPVGPLPTIVLQDGGDAILVIGDENSSQQSVVISKTAMSLASPVWKAMFERHWRENEASEIPLPDDDIEAMLLVLRIAHLRFHELPKKNGLSIDALLNLAIVCDKYDIVKLARPFLDLHGWAQYHLPNTDNEKNCNPEWFFIAWTFGYRDSFKQLAGYIVTRIGLNADGTATVEGDQGFHEHMPPGLLESMLDIRAATITSMLQVCYEVLDRILEGPFCRIDPPAKEQCRFMILGSYISFLAANGLYPVRITAAETSLSIEGLKSLIDSKAFTTYESHDYREIAHFCRPRTLTSNEYHDRLQGCGITSHEYCADMLKLKSGVKSCYKKVCLPMMDSHKRHMEEQAMK